MGWGVGHQGEKKKKKEVGHQGGEKKKKKSRSPGERGKWKHCRLLSGGKRKIGLGKEKKRKSRVKRGQGTEAVTKGKETRTVCQGEGRAGDWREAKRGEKKFMPKIKLCIWTFNEKRLFIENQVWHKLV